VAKNITGISQKISNAVAAVKSAFSFEVKLPAFSLALAV
jgi:hypothetical protein